MNNVIHAVLQYIPLFECIQAADSKVIIALVSFFYCIRCNFREGFILANFMSLWRIAKLKTCENLVCFSIIMLGLVSH